MPGTKTSLLSYTTSGGLVLLGTTLNDWALLIGMICAIATFAINWYYKHQHLRTVEKAVAVSLLNGERDVV